MEWNRETVEYEEAAEDAQKDRMINESNSSFLELIFSLARRTLLLPMSPRRAYSSLTNSTFCLVRPLRKQLNSFTFSIIVSLDLFLNLLVNFSRIMNGGYFFYHWSLSEIKRDKRWHVSAILWLNEIQTRRATNSQSPICLLSLLVLLLCNWGR